MTDTQILQKITEITDRTKWPYVYATKIDPKMSKKTRENLDNMVKMGKLRRHSTIKSFDNYSLKT